MAKPTNGPANPLADLKRALIGHMLDTKQSSINVSPDSAGRVLLAPDDWDVVYSQDREGIHLELIDNEEQNQSRLTSVLNGSDDQNFSLSYDG
jgi:hypothetical protein